MPIIKKINLPDGSSYDIQDANAIPNPATKKADDFLKYNGTEWTTAAIPTTSHTVEGSELVIETDYGGDTSAFATKTYVAENTVGLTGNNTITGTKTFNGDVTLNSGLTLKSSGNAVLHAEGVSTNVDYIDIWVDGGSNKNRPLVLQTNSNTTGNVGIGTATPSSKLQVVGAVTANGFNANNNKLTNLAAPTANTDAANKSYVDTAISNLNLGTTSELVKYANSVLTTLGGTQIDLSGGAKIETGSYVGTGTYGSANPCSLTFSFLHTFLKRKYTKK